MANAEESAPADLSCLFFYTATVEPQHVGSPWACVFTANRLLVTGRVCLGRVTLCHSYECVKNTQLPALVTDLRDTPLPISMV